jgi:NADH-quinone oxidoreductase subunit L
MLSNLWIIPALPLIGFLTIGTLGLWKLYRKGERLGRPIVYWVCCGVIGLAFLLSISCFVELTTMPPGDRVFETDLLTWIPGNNIRTTGGELAQFNISWGLQFDPLSAIFLLFVTGIGFLIHVYSIGYMWEEEGFWRFFAYLNLFMFMMLVLILSNNYMGLFVGWEGVGLCSYLLIGYYTRKRSAGDAAKKAFVVNRIGDFGFVLGMFLIFSTLGTLDFTEGFSEVARLSPGPEVGWGVLSWIALLLFIGACAKSAQIPLYVWLPDAMEGPTPVSALIHAATMVTAGVYMVARSTAIYSRTPEVLAIVAGIGILTAVVAASIGLFQRDIKKVLAYSTVSQLGYMFTALGVGAVVAAIFHVFTHAFFKALLFLGSGSVIRGMHHEQDMLKMGGLRKYMPVTYRTMLVGTLAIAGIPPLAGFFSKDEILWKVFDHGSYFIWVIGAIVAGMTSFYMFRLIFLTFFGEERFEDASHVHESPRTMTIPLLVLALGSVMVGFLGMPVWSGLPNVFGDFLEPAFKHTFLGEQGAHHAPIALEIGLAVLSVVIAVVGFLLARYFFLQRQATFEVAGVLKSLYRWVYSKYYVDEIYDAVAVHPIKGLGNFLSRFDTNVVDGIVNGTATLTRVAAWISGMFDREVVDRMVNMVAEVVNSFSLVFRKLQTGLMQRYALFFVFGVVALLTFYLVGV